MADIQCPQCGRRALGVATRCPHCGEGFPPHLLQHPGTGSRDRSARLLLGAGAGLVLGLWLLTGRSGSGSRATAPPRAGAEDTVPAAPPAPAPAPAADSAPAVVLPAPGQSPPLRALRRYARTWVNVRAARSGAAPGISVLSPGETVLVDSLRRGWYRVLSDGHPLGYVDRTYLDTIPPGRRSPE